MGRLYSFFAPFRRGKDAKPGPMAPIVLLFLLVAACDTPVKPDIPSMGFIEVTTIAEGADLVPDSFTVQIDGSRSGAVAPRGTFLIKALPRGDYMVGLSGGENACRFSANPRRVSVTPNETATTTFLVWCR